VLSLVEISVEGQNFCQIGFTGNTIFEKYIRAQRRSSQHFSGIFSFYDKEQKI
jgi:hypothetical protein